MALVIKLILMAFILIPISSVAQQIRVEKVKGNKAVIEFSGDLTPGKTYSIRDKSGHNGVRKYVISGSMEFTSSTYAASSLSASVKHNDLNLSARFGWNYEVFEFGPIFGYRNIDSGYVDQHFTSFSGGVFVDYNFTPNHPEASAIFGLTGEGIFGSLTPNSGSSASTTGFFAGGFFKWFGLTDSTALRADLGYDYLKTTADTSNNTLQGFVFRGGIATYF